MCPRWSLVFNDHHLGSIEHVGGIYTDKFKQMNRALQRLDRF